MPDPFSSSKLELSIVIYWAGKINTYIFIFQGFVFYKTVAKESEYKPWGSELDPSSSCFVGSVPTKLGGRLIYV